MNLWLHYTTLLYITLCSSGKTVCAGLPSGALLIQFLFKFFVLDLVYVNNISSSVQNVFESLLEDK